MIQVLYRFLLVLQSFALSIQPRRRKHSMHYILRVLFEELIALRNSTEV